MAKSTAPSSRSAQVERPERSGNPPVFSVRHRALKATVWKNETENGPMYNTTLSRSYKSDSDEWRESTSFGWDDLLIVAELLRTCYGFIAREMAKQGQQSRE
jgi:hypothetical protein